jgi:hypothetical protein
LKLLCDAIENGSISLNDINALPKEIDELFKEKYELDYYYSFYGRILNSFPKDEMGLITYSAKNTKEYKDVKQKYDLAKRKSDNFNTSKEGKELIKFQGKIRDRMDRMEISRHYRDLAEELAKGTEHEMEHLATLKKVAEHKITPEEAVVQTAKTHIAENPEYYEDLAKMELNELLDKLKKQGYNATIPSNSKRINVIGLNKGYFRAKKQMAKSIIETLKANGYNAVSELDSDGYYDFYVYPSEQQDLQKMEKENEVVKFAFNYSEKELAKHITNSELDNFVKNAKFNSTAMAYNYPIPRRSGEDWHLYISIQKPSRMGSLHNKYWANLYDEARL